MKPQESRTGVDDPSRRLVVRVLSVFGVGDHRRGQPPRLRNGRLFGLWGALVDGLLVFFKHEDSGSGPALAQRFLALREGSTE